MEVDEEPINPTDPVEDILPAHSPEVELEEVPTAGESVPPCPDETGSSTVVPREDGDDLIEESQKDSLQREQVGEAGAEGRPSVMEEALEPQEMDATPAVTPPSPKAALEMEERANVAEYLAPTPEGCDPHQLVVYYGFSSTAEGEAEEETMSLPEGSEIADGLVSAVKQHCGSASESAPNSRLPGRMPYGSSSRADGEEPRAVGGEGNQTPMLQRSGDSRTPPATPERRDHSPDLSLEEEPEEHLFVTPPEGDRPSGIARYEFTEAEGDTSGNFSEWPDKLAAPRSQLTLAKTPDGTEPQPPAGPDAPDEGTRRHTQNLVAASTRPSLYGRRLPTSSSKCHGGTYRSSRASSSVCGPLTRQSRRTPTGRIHC